ncbi:MAG: NADH-quinone oxidoreductase subunit C [Bacteroidales bacterium]|nr:NADH-quinone oxidoreductase subunit C [Bacteroidales bacterium]MBN2757242.1 NADH-quinone oxidoreductase subunit C [Bacteroidales bacterium]
MSEQIKEKETLEALTKTFEKVNGIVQRDKRVIVETDAEIIPGVLLYAKERLKFTHFSHMSCVDWIENNQFELVYILWSPEDKIQLIIKCVINREKPIIQNIDNIWRQANTYEREIREMFGVEFEGLIGAKEFILEDWDDIPPMRKDFDTKEYSSKHFFDRPGREDAKDVRTVITERSGEEIPDFAKKYSRD